jgi:hypothetical protein
MVDLDDAFRPAGPAASRLPVGEIAARARRRRRRRVIRAVGVSAGLVTAGLLGATTLLDGSADTDLSTIGAADLPAGPERDGPEATGGEVVGIEPDRPIVGESPVSVAPTSTPDRDPTGSDQPSSDASTAPATEPATSGAGPEPEVEPGPDDTAPATPGIRTTSTTTSAWEDGYCVRVRVDNDGADAVTWRVVFEQDGTIATLWNATAEAADDGSTVFAGADWNATLSPGGWTTFGLCLDTDPA